MSINLKHQEKQQESEKQAKFDIYKIDYDWIAKTSNKKELRAAYETLVDDGGYPDLLRTLENKICEVDPAFKKKLQANEKLSYEAEKAINDELGDFLNQIGQTDQKLQEGMKESQQKNNIFADESQSEQQQQQQRGLFKSAFAEELEKKKLAENERLKGNECMKSKDFTVALECYSKSIELYPEEAATYSNRAMTYIKLKDFGKAIEDANKAISLKPDYLKAYHRRATAYNSTNKIELAIKDFQFILEKEPENKDALKELMVARDKLKDKLEKPKQTQEKQETQQKSEKAKQESKEKTESITKTDKFVRVAIQEESDDEEGGGEEEQQMKKQEGKNADQSNKENNNPSVQQQNVQQLSKLEDASTQKQSQEKDKLWWKQSDMKYEDFNVDNGATTPSLSEQQQQPTGSVKMKIEEVQSSEQKLKKEDEQRKQQEKTAQEQFKKAEQEQQQKLEQEKKQEQKVLDELFEKIDTIKEEAAGLYRKGLYEEAVASYEKGVESIQKQQKISQFKHLKKQIYEKEATLYSNMAACFKQGQHSKKEVEFCTKVIERSPYITDMNMLAKAYLRRGYAYEHLEKFNEAKEDMLCVRQIQSSNLQASQALERIEKALKHSQKQDHHDLENKLLRIKEQGNGMYSQKKYADAIKKFTEGIDLYWKDEKNLKKHESIKIKVTQLYTNRCLSYHQLNQQKEALNDAEYVLHNVDSLNVKMLFRRAHAYKHFKNYEGASKDLQVLLKNDPNNQSIKQDLNDCLAKMIEQQKQKQQTGETTQKPQEKQPQQQEKKVKIEEVGLQQNKSNILDVEEQEEEQKELKLKKKSMKTPNLQEDVVSKAAEKAALELRAQKINNVPKTASVFEHDLNSFKNDPASIFQYVLNIPASTIESLFKTAEVRYEQFIQIIKIFKDQLQSEKVSAEEQKLIAQFLVSISKSYNFDMTLMFLDTKEKKDIKDVLTQLKKNGIVDKSVISELETIYI